jgi:hypothetical protein
VGKRHIGLDFDNTIVTYDRVFHRLACARGLIPATTPPAKRAVRDALRALPGGNDVWTELQGIVYGERMNEAEPTTGACEFIRRCLGSGLEISIISHKSVFPAMGPRVNLRDAAWRWLEERKVVGTGGLERRNVVFLDTIGDKLNEIARRGCSHFVDDLVEILDHKDFPAEVTRVLYAPDGAPAPSATILACRNWNEVAKAIGID